jgi:hypothetical protein
MQYNFFGTGLERAAAMYYLIGFCPPECMQQVYARFVRHQATVCASHACRSVAIWAMQI